MVVKRYAELPSTRLMSMVSVPSHDNRRSSININLSSSKLSQGWIIFEKDLMADHPDEFRRNQSIMRTKAEMFSHLYPSTNSATDFQSSVLSNSSKQRREEIIDDIFTSIKHKLFLR